MQILASEGTVSRLWRQLNAPYAAGRRDKRRTAYSDVLSEGWAAWHDIEDVLWEMDSRTDVIARFNGDLQVLLDTFDLRMVQRFRGPFSGRHEVYGHKAMAVIDLAVLLMEVERLGFTVDSEEFVETLRPTLVRRKYLTNSELSVLWHKRLTHRSEMLVLRSNLQPVCHKTITTHSGYRATALLAESGEAAVLRVDAPKRRGDMRLDLWIDLGLRHPAAVLG